MVHHIASAADMKKTIADAGGKLIVVDFTATWCGPCQRVAPLLEQWAAKYTDVVFVKVDVDDVPDVTEEYGVNCMPTFKFIKNGKVVHTIEGADVNGILAQIEKSK